jgi:hypothetical protein
MILTSPSSRGGKARGHRPAAAALRSTIPVMARIVINIWVLSVLAAAAIAAGAALQVPSARAADIDVSVHQFAFTLHPHMKGAGAAQAAIGSGRVC